VRFFRSNLVGLALTLTAPCVGCSPDSADSQSAGGNVNSSSSVPTDSSRHGTPDVAETAANSDVGSVSVQPVDFDGYRAVVTKHRGRVVVVDLWATWCIPCVQNFPHLVEMHEKYASRGVACVSLSLDNLGSEETTVERMLPAVREFLIKQSAAFDNLIATQPFDEMAAADKLGVGQIPAVFVFNKSGEQMRLFTPGPDLPPAKMYAEVESLVVELLGESK